MTYPEHLNLKDSTNLVASVPYLIGYHPHDQIVIVAAKNFQVLFAAAATLPHFNMAGGATDIAVRLTAHGPNQVILVGYGPREAVIPLIDRATDAFTNLNVTVLAAFCTYDDWLWHLHCDNAQCQTGMAFDASTTEAAAQATFTGLVAVEDRYTYIARLNPVTGEERKGMQTALTAAHRHLSDLFAGTSQEPIRTRVRQLTEQLLDAALATYEKAERLTDEAAGLLITVLSVCLLGDGVLSRVNGEDRDIRLWTDLTRRADPDHAAAPAALLALAALQSGQGLLARLAIERAKESAPMDPLIPLIAEAIEYGVTPEAVRSLLHPEEGSNSTRNADGTWQF
ncbi:DUF4192 domain-containing protein [Actinoplanes sp. NPDC020271]|uniref:DUF4192 domain-containing protein n=1 Tax=Actinoplanes sp. NPDC020271 TaxID=3363896 RepID=UPI00378C9488